MTERTRHIIQALVWTVAIVGGIIIFSNLLMGFAHAAECRTEPNDKGQWSWRYIEPHEHKKCWYQGRRIIPKSQLHWAKQEDKPKSKEEPKPIKTDVLPPKAEIIFPPLLTLQHGVDADLLNATPSTMWPLILDADAMQAEAEEPDVRDPTDFNELDAQADNPPGFNERWPTREEMWKYVRKVP